MARLSCSQVVDSRQCVGRGAEDSARDRERNKLKQLSDTSHVTWWTGKLNHGGDAGGGSRVTLCIVEGGRWSWKPKDDEENKKFNEHTHHKSNKVTQEAPPASRAQGHTN